MLSDPFSDTLWIQTHSALNFYLRGSIASYASNDIAIAEMSVCLSVTLWYCIKTNKAGVMIFLPCDVMRCTVLVIVILSVCLSVCPSVTLVCVHMVRPTIIIFSPNGSATILVSAGITFISKFEGGHPERGR